MILFASAHDEPTRANHAIALRIQNDSDTFIEGDDATRENLWAALEVSNAPLFAMSHGDVDKLWAQGGNASSPALDTADLSVLRGRPVFAHACFTARELGRRASKQGSFWWGYQ